MIGYDFIHWWVYAQLVRRGLNPYDFPLLVAELQKIDPGAFSYNMGGNLYPPWLLTFILPLSYLPLDVARVLWLLIQTTLFAVCAILWRTQVEAREDSGRLPLLLYIVATVCLPFLGTLVWGQLQGLLLFSVVTANRLVSARRYFFAGLALAICAVKPHPVYLVLLWTMSRCPLLVMPRVLSGLTAGLVLLNLWPLLLRPTLIGDYWVAAPGLAQQAEVMSGASLAEQLTHFGLPWARLIMPLMGVALLAVFIRRRDSRAEGMLPFLAASSLTLTPHCWFHDFSILLPAYLQQVRRSFERFGEAVRYLCLLHFFLLLPAAFLYSLSPWVSVYPAAILITMLTRKKECPEGKR